MVIHTAVIQHSQIGGRIVTLPRPPHWALATLHTYRAPLATLILEPKTADSSAAIRKQLTMAGSIGKIGPQDWQRREWLSSGQLHVLHTDREVTSFTASGSALQLPGTLGANREWIDSANTGHVLFVVMPHESSPTLNQLTSSDAIEFLLADLAMSHRLFAGLATATRQPIRT